MPSSSAVASLGLPWLLVLPLLVVEGVKTRSGDLFEAALRQKMVKTSEANHFKKALKPSYDV